MPIEDHTVDGRYNLGLLHEKRGHLKDAEREYSLAIADAPENRAAFRARGLVRMKLDQSSGALGAAFLDPQGEVLARAGDEAATDVLGAYQSVWLTELGRAADRAGLGPIADLSFEFEGRRVLTAPVKAGFFLLVVLSPEGRPSVARARIDDVRVRLASEVS